MNDGLFVRWGADDEAFTGFVAHEKLATNLNST
jgi:hypothetical protein